MQNMHQIEVGQDMDRVMLYIRRVVIPLPYASAFKIAATILSASTHCFIRVHEDKANKSDMMAVELNIDDRPVLSDLRRGTMPARFDWKVDVEVERVIIYLGGHIIKQHFSEAMKLSTRIKIQAKKAKCWAGDTSRQWILTGHLTDAEENYKLGI